MKRGESRYWRSWGLFRRSKILHRSVYSALWLGGLRCQCRRQTNGPLTARCPCVMVLGKKKKKICRPTGKMPGMPDYQSSPVCKPINLVSYARENCVLYARQQISYHMHGNKFHIICTRKLLIICTPINFVSYARQSLFFFCVSIPQVFVFIWRIICIFTRQGYRAHINPSAVDGVYPAPPPPSLAYISEITGVSGGSVSKELLWSMCTYSARGAVRCSGPRGWCRWRSSARCCASPRASRRVRRAASVLNGRSAARLPRSTASPPRSRATRAAWSSPATRFTDSIPAPSADRRTPHSWTWATTGEKQLNLSVYCLSRLE